MSLNLNLNLDPGVIDVAWVRLRLSPKCQGCALLTLDLGASATNRSTAFSWDAAVRRP